MASLQGRARFRDEPRQGSNGTPLTKTSTIDTASTLSPCSPNLRQALMGFMHWECKLARPHLAKKGILTGSHDLKSSQNHGIDTSVHEQPLGATPRVVLLLSSTPSWLVSQDRGIPASGNPSGSRHDYRRSWPMGRCWMGGGQNLATPFAMEKTGSSGTYCCGNSGVLLSGFLVLLQVTTCRRHGKRSF